MLGCSTQNYHLFDVAHNYLTEFSMFISKDISINDLFIHSHSCSIPRTVRPVAPAAWSRRQQLFDFITELGKKRLTCVPREPLTASDCLYSPFRLGVLALDGRRWGLGAASCVAILLPRPQAARMTGSLGPLTVAADLQAAVMLQQAAH